MGDIMKSLVDWLEDRRNGRMVVMAAVGAILLSLAAACLFLICFGCEKKTEEQTVREDGLVTMRAEITEDDRITFVCTIVNKTKKDIMIGEEYHLQVLKGKSFVDVQPLPEAGAFNLSSIDILSGQEYSYRAYIEDNYGDLEAGRYRIVKEYTNKEKGSQKKENAGKETVSAEFDLPQTRN